MDRTAVPLEVLIDELKRLPGLGEKTATRLAYQLMNLSEQQTENLVQAIRGVHVKLNRCCQCQNYTEGDTCPICADPSRDHTTICVVETPRDVQSIERTREYRGLYHVLGGVISPMQGIAPSDLKIDLLCERVARGGVQEVIIAISTSVEGETTLFYLMNRLRQFPGLRITSIARGIGFGDELEYVDELTITHALRNRREIE